MHRFLLDNRGASKTNIIFSSVNRSGIVSRRHAYFPFRIRFRALFRSYRKKKGKMGKEEKDKSMNPLEEPPSERFDLSMGLVIDTASPPREKDCLRFDLDAETAVERRERGS